MENIKETLEREIQEEIESLGEFDLGSAERKAMVDSITKLTDRLIEIGKIEAESRHKDANRLLEEVKIEKEERIKLKQAKDNNILKWVEIGVTIVGIAVPTAVKIWGTNKTLRFEETGTVTTMSGRAHINSLFSKK